LLFTLKNPFSSYHKKVLLFLYGFVDELTQLWRGSAQRKRILDSGIRSRGFAGGVEGGNRNETLGFCFWHNIQNQLVFAWESQFRKRETHAFHL